MDQKGDRSVLDKQTVLKASGAYFVLVFGAGFILGIFRTLFLVPRLGVRYAELLEMPVMFVVIFVSAKWIVQRFKLRSFGSQLIVGLIALALMIGIEFSVVLKLRGLSLGDYFEQRDPISGAAYFVMLGVFATMPRVVRLLEERSQRASRYRALRS